MKGVASGLDQNLYTAVVGDILDALGRRHQFLPQPIRPMRESMRLAGRAMPVLLAEAAGDSFGKLTEALDQIGPGEVYLVTGGPGNCAAWGELLTATARVRGGAGAVIDGYHRDTPQILEQNWPVFSRGAWAQDMAPRARVVDFRCAIVIGGVTVEPGDLLFGDVDGVVVVPSALEEEVVAKALEKVRGEKVARRDIESGESATAVFRKYGIL